MVTFQLSDNFPTVKKSVLSRGLVQDFLRRQFENHKSLVWPQRLKSQTITLQCWSVYLMENLRWKPCKSVGTSSGNEIGRQRKKASGFQGSRNGFWPLINDSFAILVSLSSGKFAIHFFAVETMQERGHYSENEISGRQTKKGSAVDSIDDYFAIFLDFGSAGTAQNYEFKVRFENSSSTSLSTSLRLAKTLNTLNSLDT